MSGGIEVVIGREINQHDFFSAWESLGQEGPFSAWGRNGAPVDGPFLSGQYIEVSAPGAVVLFSPRRLEDDESAADFIEDEYMDGVSAQHVVEKWDAVRRSYMLAPADVQGIESAGFITSVVALAVATDGVIYSFQFPYQWCRGGIYHPQRFLQLYLDRESSS